MSAHEPIGRAAEVTHLAQLARESAAGAKRGVVLTGPPGIGKTTLLRWLYDEVQEKGFARAYVRAPATAGLPPRFPIGEVLEGLIESCRARNVEPPIAAVRVVDTLRGNKAADPYPAAPPQIAFALEAVGRLLPVAVFIDDWHWTPPESAELLLAALRVIEAPLLFATTVRAPADDERARAPLPEPSADLPLDVAPVEGLDVAGVLELAHARLGGPLLPSWGATLHALTAGNPLFVTELLRHCRESHALSPVAGHWDLDEVSLASSAHSLDAIVGTRLHRLTLEHQITLGTIALLGHDARFDEIARMGNATREDLAAILDFLCRGGFAHLSPASDSYRLAHPAYEPAIVAQLGRVRCAVIHSSILDVQRTSGATSASEVAHHALSALDPPDDLAMLLAEAASEATAAGSYREAARWHEEVVRHHGGDTYSRARASFELATAAIHFDPKRAIGLLTEVAERAPFSVQPGRLYLKRAEARRMEGSLSGAIADLDLAATWALPTDRFEIMHAKAVLHGIHGRLDQAEALLRQLAEDHPDQRYKATGHLGMVEFARGNLQEAFLHFGDSLARCVDPEYRAFLRTNYVWLLVLVGEWEQAGREIVDCRRDFLSRGDLWNLDPVLCSGARFFAWRGALSDALDYSRQALRVANSLANPASELAARGALVLTLMEAGALDEAEGAAEDCLALLDHELEPRELPLTLIALAELALKGEHLDQCASYLESAELSLGQAAVWRESLLRTRAAFQLRTGEPKVALLTLEDALESTVPLPYERARTFEQLAHTRWALGDRLEAQRNAATAMEIYSRLGSSLRATAVREWAEEHQPKVRGRPRQRSARGLTVREEEVMSLVEQGLTDRQIARRLYVSPETVRTHVENLKLKAGVGRRTELVRHSMAGRDFNDVHPRG